MFESLKKFQPIPISREKTSEIDKIKHILINGINNQLDYIEKDKKGIREPNARRWYKLFADKKSYEVHLKYQNKNVPLSDDVGGYRCANLDEVAEFLRVMLKEIEKPESMKFIYKQIKSMSLTGGNGRRAKNS